jgi:hypothetical protein
MIEWESPEGSCLNIAALLPLRSTEAPSDPFAAAEGKKRRRRLN